ncbi:unnamed protein product [Phytophthora lilii]|uniref:Unnamed protein product n=1 Tax=Phytophthora lilii TaxID=2077276 RepID=A0A9W6WLQ2_9STRA|nr:unnamed protein product [Phytophthora lilii]
MASDKTSLRLGTRICDDYTDPSCALYGRCGGTKSPPILTPKLTSGASAPSLGDSSAGPQHSAMDLTAEDDDLLSYFLAADVAAEQMPRAGGAAAGAAAEQFTLGQTVPLAPERAFGGDLAPAASPAGAGGQSAPAFPHTQGSFTESSMMRPSSNDDETSSNTGGLDSDEKRQRRLARNRESARQSRRRKKQYLELLEEKVSQLTESIDATRASHLERADEALNQVRSDILKSLADDLKKGGSAETYLSKLKKSLELRSEAVQRQTEMLHSILTPEQSLTYLQWVDANQNRLPDFVDTTQSLTNTGASDAVRAILNKDDRDLTVEDVTALLQEL